MKKIKSLMWMGVFLACLIISNVVNADEVGDFRKNFIKNPVWGFTTKPEWAWLILEQEPKLFEKIEIMAAAFDADYKKTTKIVDNNLFLLEKTEVKKYIINKIEELAPIDISILQNNLNLQKEWFSHYGIIDKGALVKNYSKGLVKVMGVTFDIKQVKGATLTIYGGVILQNKAEIYRGTLEIKNGKIKIINGNIDITNSEIIDILAINDGSYSVITDGKKMFTIEEKRGKLTKTQLIKEKDYLAIQGENILIFKKHHEEWELGSILFSGKIIFDKERMTLEKDTDYASCLNGSLNVRYQTKAKTDFYNKSEGCKDEVEISCVEEDRNLELIRVILKNDNKIHIETFSSSSYLNLYVDSIDDNSELIFIDKGFVRMVFSRKPFTIEGYLYKISINVYYTFFKFGEEHEINIINKKLYYCSVCETKGAISTIDLKEVQTREIMLFENVYSWALDAVGDERYVSLGGAKGKYVYPDKYEEYDIKKRTSIEEYKKIMIKKREGSIDRYVGLKKELEEKLKGTTEEQEKIKLKNSIETYDDYIKELENQIEKIKKIEYAYDCIGFVQGALIESEKKINGPYRWYKETDGFKLIRTLTKKYPLKPVLVVFGKRINKTHYIHGRIKEPAVLPPEVVKANIEILFFGDRKERDEYLRSLCPGSPFQNYNPDGTPHHCGIKGVSENSIEAHIFNRKIDVDPVNRYNDPLLFAFLKKKKLTLEDIIAIAKK